MIWVDTEGDIHHAVDWNWLRPDEWMMNNRDSTGSRWYPPSSDARKKELDLNEGGRRAILEAFGLLDQKDKFPIEKLRCTSPAKLIAFRRQLEEADQTLERVDVVSDRAGGHIKAEDCS